MIGSSVLLQDAVQSCPGGYGQQDWLSYKLVVGRHLGKWAVSYHHMPGGGGGGGGISVVSLYHC
jgi:hypothetical protein